MSAGSGPVGTAESGCGADMACTEPELRVVTPRVFQVGIRTSMISSMIQGNVNVVAAMTWPSVPSENNIVGRVGHASLRRPLVSVKTTAVKNLQQILIELVVTTPRFQRRMDDNLSLRHGQ